MAQKHQWESAELKVDANETFRVMTFPYEPITKSREYFILCGFIPSGILSK